MITLCVITKNEEKHLAKCLSSFSSYADQIIVGDSGSTDQTIHIAKKFNAEIIHIEWCDDYSYARNICITAAKNEWVLFLDADEFLIGGQKLIKWLKRTSLAVGGCLLERKDAFVDHETNKFTEVPVGTVRLFRKHKQICFREPVHEIVAPSIIEAGYEIEVVRGVYIHHAINTHSKSFLDQKQTKYLRLLNQRLSTDINNSWARYQKGKTLWYFEKIEEAKESFVQVINTANSIEHKVGALNNLGAISLKYNSPEEAIRHLKKSLEILPNQSQAYFILGDCYLKIGSRKKALFSFLKVETKLNVQEKMIFIPGGLFLYDYQKYYRLALSLIEFPVLSSTMIFLALRRNPKYLDALYLKYQLKKASGKNYQAAQLLNKMKSINPLWSKIPNHN